MYAPGLSACVPGLLLPKDRRTATSGFDVRIGPPTPLSHLPRYMSKSRLKDTIRQLCGQYMLSIWGFITASMEIVHVDLSVFVLNFDGAPTDQTRNTSHQSQTGRNDRTNHPGRNRQID